MDTGIESIFNSFEEISALIIGDVMIDSYIIGDVERISPEAPVPIVRAKEKEYRLGGAANVALNLQSLRAEPVICAVVGDDEKGDLFMDMIHKNHLKSEGILRSNERKTTVKSRIFSGSQHIVRVDFEDDHSIENRFEDELFEKIAHLIKNCQVVIFEDYDKGTITETIIKKTITLANELNIPTVVDPKERNFKFYKDVTLFKPNLRELQTGLDIQITSYDLQGIIKATTALHDQLNCKGSLVTLSSRGVFIDFDGERHHLSAHRRICSGFPLFWFL